MSPGGEADVQKKFMDSFVESKDLHPALAGPHDQAVIPGGEDLQGGAVLSDPGGFGEPEPLPIPCTGQRVSP